MSKVMKLIPELRFPDFVNNEVWLEKKLGKIGEPLMCKRIFKDQTTPNSENGIPFYKIGTFGRKADSYISLDLYNEFKSKYNFPIKGDILISASGTIGRLVIYDGVPAYFQDSNIVWLGHDGKQVTNEFLFYCYSMVKWQTSDGGVIKRLYNSDLKNISIYYPESKLEQKKIVSCLSSLDELIAAHKEKLDALKDHKKGLMQNLFPQEGETVPKLRFKEFEGDGEWELKPLEDISKITTGNKDTQDKIYDGKYPFFVRSQTIERINSYSFDGEAILTSGDGVGVGKIYHYIIGKFDFHQRVYCIYNFNEDVEGKFIFYFFSEHFYQRVMQLSAKNSVDSVRRFMITEMPIAVPPSKEEQKKIASCLSAVDELIAAQQEKIEQLKNHKKGLMQGLFPKIES